MKKIIHSLFLLFCLLTALLYFSACKKDRSKVNITLYNKPLSTIKSYIVGKWDLKYEQGGISSLTFPQTNFFSTFTSDNRVTESYHDTIIVDASISWVRDIGSNIGLNNLTYVMRFRDKEEVPWNYVVDGIFNDTLVIHDNGSDAMYYHFAKVK